MIKIQKSSWEFSDILMIVYCTSAFLSGVIPAAKPMILISSIAMALIAAIKKRGRISIRLGGYFVLPAVFMIYCAITAIWAREPTPALQAALTFFQILLTLCLASLHYQDRPVAKMLQAIMFGGYAACLIELQTTGINAYIGAILVGTRITRGYLNANVMGRLMAMCLIINIYYILNEKRIRWWTVFAIPAFICLFGTGSRSGFLMLTLGVGMLLVLKNINSKKKIISMLKVLLIISGFIALIIFLLNMPVFALIRNRFQNVINVLLGRSVEEGSARIRANMIVFGWKLFKKVPFFGVGIFNPSYYSPYGGYLHDNFVELLAGGGLIGFLLYYSIYVYIFWNFWKYRKYRTGEFDCCLVVLLSVFILDVSNVTFQEKQTWICFMTGFLEIQYLKDMARRKECRHEFC